MSAGVFVPAHGWRIGADEVDANDRSITGGGGGGGPARDRAHDPRTLAVIGASERWVWSLPFDDRSRTARWTRHTARLVSNADITATAAVPSPAGCRVYCGMSTGALLLLDGDGNPLENVALARGAIRFLAAARVRGQVVVAAACADRTLRVVDDAGRPIVSFETPGTVLSLDIGHGAAGGLEIVGGIGQDGRAFVWNLDRVIHQRDATPDLILGTGRQPAYGARFWSDGVHRWAVHGSWDGGLSLYDLRLASAMAEPPGSVLWPTSILTGRDPLYEAAVTPFLGTPHIFAGSESGTVYGWGFDAADGSLRTRITFSPVPTAVKWLRTVRVDPGAHLHLLVGARHGDIWLIDPHRPAQAPERWSGESAADGGVSLCDAR